MVEYVEFKEEKENNDILTPKTDSLFLLIVIHTWIVFIFSIVSIWIDFQNENFILILFLFVTSLTLHIIIFRHKYVTKKYKYLQEVADFIENRKIKK